MLLSRKGVFMVFYADAHCDTLIYAKKKGSSLFDHPGHVNLKMLESLSDKFLQFMAIWINPKCKNIKKRAMEVIGFYKEQEKDIAGKINGGLILSLEGGETLDGSIDSLFEFYDRGARSLCLTWNGENALGCGCLVSDKLFTGLTCFGKQVVREMDKLHMIIDCSHSSKALFFDVAELCAGPFMASHSNCFSICSHPRNLSDDQLRIIGEKKGFVGINLYPSFLSDSGSAGEDSIMAHIDHALNIAPYIWHLQQKILCCYRLYFFCIYPCIIQAN